MKQLTLFTAVLIFILLPSGCSRKQSKVVASAPEVLVTVVAPKDVPVVVESVATLDGLVNATITPRVSGHIISQDYKEGTAVKKPDLLFQIDPPPFHEPLSHPTTHLPQPQPTHTKPH